MTNVDLFLSQQKIARAKQRGSELKGQLKENRQLISELKEISNEKEVSMRVLIPFA